MSEVSQYDVLVVGAGIVGATLACALGGSALKVCLVDRQVPPPPPVDDYDLRVSAITRASQRVFESLDCWPGMLSRRVSPFREMRVWDAGGGGEVHFDCARIGEPYLGHIIENSVVVTALHERLDGHANVDCLLSDAIVDLDDDDRGVLVTLASGRRLRARLLVGADGARSRVRQFAGIRSRGWSYEQTGIVANVATARPHGEVARQRFLSTGPLAFLPLADGRCSIVWSVDTSEADALLGTGDEEFKARLGEAFEHTLGEIVEVSPRAGFPLRLAHAQAYVRERLVLVGDAAHSIHPLAGQGANLGIADAATLAQVLLEALARRQDIGRLAVLRRYERWRKGDNLLMMAAMDGFQRLFGTDRAPLRLLRTIGLTAVNAAPPLKDMIMRRAMGLEGDLPKLSRGESLLP